MEVIEEGLGIYKECEGRKEGEREGGRGQKKRKGPMQREL